MKVDYYIGVDPNIIIRMLLNGHFYEWHNVIKQQIDSKVISVTNRTDIIGKSLRKIQLMSGIPLIYHRRADSLLHIISVNLANPAIVLTSHKPLIVTCFDAILYEHNVEMLAKKRDEKALAAHRKLLGKADRIITLSQHARRRISEISKIDKNKIDVTYFAVDHNKFHPRFMEEIPINKLNFGMKPDKKNILYVGSESPRKNLKRIIQALPLVQTEMDVHFVKIGVPSEPYHSELRSLVRQLGLEDIVHFYGTISMEQLPFIYNLADVFVFPSLYEGFGLPVLEAMASGCPVVTSDETSLPEVAGDAAEKVDPYDHESIANGILRVLSDNEYRQYLIQKGREQALTFNWEKTAQDILNVYRKLL